MSLLRRKKWSPYLVGAAIGVLSWFAFATADRQLGITTAFEYTAALAEKAAAPAYSKENVYFIEKQKEKSRLRGVTPDLKKVPWQPNAKEMANHIAWTATAEMVRRAVAR